MYSLLFLSLLFIHLSLCICWKTCLMILFSFVLIPFVLVKFLFLLFTWIVFLSSICCLLFVLSFFCIVFFFTLLVQFSTDFYVFTFVYNQIHFCLSLFFLFSYSIDAHWQCAVVLCVIRSRCTFVKFLHQHKDNRDYYY